MGFDKNGMKESTFNKAIYLFVILLPFSYFLIPILEGKTLFWGVSSLQFIPWRSLALESLINGELPFINPFNGLGSPLLANYQLAFFYPPNWIQFPFFMLWKAQGVAISYSILIPLHLSTAAIGMILFLRSIRCSPSASAFGALAFSLSSYLIARISFISIIWTLTWLPWMLFTTTSALNSIIEKKISNRKRWRHFLALTAVFTMLLLGGHAQTAWYSILITAGWSLLFGYSINKWSTAFRSLGIFLAAGFLASMISAIQLIPTWEFLQQSQRADSIDFNYAMTYSFWPWRILTFLMPDFFGNPGNGSFWGYGNYWEDASYIGLIPLFFSIYVFFNFKKVFFQQPEKMLAVRYFGFVALISIILSLGKHTPLYGFLYHYIPTFDMFQAPSRWLILTCFSLAVLSAIGFDCFNEAKNPNQKKVFLLIIVCMGVIIAGFTGMAMLSEIPKTMSIALFRAGVIGVFGSTFAALISNSKITNKWQHWIFGIILLTGIDLLTIGSSLIPITTTSLYKNTVKEIQKPLIEPRIYILSGDEYDLKFSRFFRTHDFRPIENWNNLRLVSLPNINILSSIPYINNFDPLVPVGYQILLEFLKRGENQSVDRWLRHLNAGIIENIDVDSASGLVYSTIADSHFIHTYSCNTVFNESKDLSFYSSMEIIKFSDPEKPIFTKADSKEIIADQCLLETDVAITGLTCTNNSVEFQLKSDDPTWVELAIIWYPGWVAYQDGIKIEVNKVNGILSGAKIDSGSHRVEFKYEPESFRIGFIISSTGIIFLLIVTIIIYTRKCGKMRNE